MSSGETTSFPTFTALSPLLQSVPSYRRLGTGTNLNHSPPLMQPPDDFTEKAKSWITRDVYSNLGSKSESLAVSSLVEDGGTVDFVAPVEILKQIFMMPCSKSPVSIAVQRVGQTLVLNPGFDFDAKKHYNRPIDEEVDRTNFWLLNFAMHSRRMDGCNCSPQQITEPSGDSVIHGTSGSNEFSRVVDCKFDEFHMRLGSDLFLFKNGNNVAASLHLSDQTQQFHLLTWLEAWLDNVMACVPELAICYHENGFVYGYEILKTDDIFLQDGILGVAFNPCVVQQKGLDVLKFLRSTCKEDPGVYWLCKSDGEDVIQLFDLSKNHSSSATQLPPVINRGRSDLGNLLYRAVQRHEQLARRILSNESSVTNSSSVASFESGPVFQGPATLHQTIARLISLKQEAVDHVSEAITSLRQLPSSVQEGLPALKLDSHMWSLVLLLGESHLSLGEAYNESGDLQQAFSNVELACSIYGSVPCKFDETSFVSAMYESFALQLNMEKFEEWISKLSGHSGVLEATPEPDYTSFRSSLSSVRLFWAKVWLLVGEIYFKFTVPGQAGTRMTRIPLKMPSEVEHEAKRLNKAGSKKCASCLLVRCFCEAKSKKQSGGKDRGGIFKYLNPSSMKVDAETNMFTALACFEETRKALLPELPRDSEEIQIVIKRIGHVWNEIGRLSFKSNKHKEADEAYDHAVSEFKESGDIISALQVNCNRGIMRQKQANECSAKAQPSKKGSQRNPREELYTISIKFFQAAVADLEAATENGLVVQEELKVAVYTHLGDTHLHFADFFTKVAKEAHGQKRRQALERAREAIETAIATYGYLEKAGIKEKAVAFRKLAEHHVAKYYVEEETDVRKKHALSADENWKESKDIFMVEKEHADLLAILINRSQFCFSLPWRTKAMLESDLCNLLEARQISKTDEESLKKFTDAFWIQVRKVLKEMLSETKKEGGDEEKLRKLYGKSLQPTSLSEDLHAMHHVWTG